MIAGQANRAIKPLGKIRRVQNNDLKNIFFLLGDAAVWSWNSCAAQFPHCNSEPVDRPLKMPEIKMEPRRSEMQPSVFQEKYFLRSLLWTPPEQLLSELVIEARLKVKYIVSWYSGGSLCSFSVAERCHNSRWYLILFMIMICGCILYYDLSYFKTLFSSFVAEKMPVLKLH